MSDPFGIAQLQLQMQFQLRPWKTETLPVVVVPLQHMQPGVRYTYTNGSVELLHKTTDSDTSIIRYEIKCFVSQTSGVKLTSLKLVFDAVVYCHDNAVHTVEINTVVSNPSLHLPINEEKDVQHSKNEKDEENDLKLCAEKAVRAMFP